ncbi:DUF4124 domain-containing protein [Chitinibacteraceae bacterium HSL-7]
MKKGWLIAVLWLAVAAPVQAALYRWVDENGNVQFSDKPPRTDPKGGVTELNKSGTVRKSPQQAETEEARKARETAERDAADQRRRDKALLQSFSTPEDVDRLRDRQIEALNGQIQTSQARRNHTVERLDRLKQRETRLKDKKRAVPAELQAEMAAATKEMTDIDKDIQSKRDEIETTRQRAAADKARLIELQQSRR